MNTKTIQQINIGILDTPISNDTLILFESIDRQHKTRKIKELLKASFDAGLRSYGEAGLNFEEWIKTFKL